jgi:hypothetical protein
MKKLLLMVVVLAGCVALVGTAFAGAGRCAPPKCVPPVVKPATSPPSIVIPEIVEKKVRSEIIFCKGAAKGKERLCGPCAPTITWSGSWKTAELGPEKVFKYQIIKKGKLIKERPAKKVAAPCYY